MTDLIAPAAQGLVSLDDERLLLFQGPDADNVLHGQTTADTKALPVGHSVGGAFCDVKGRVIADFLALRLEAEVFALRVSADLTDLLSEHLKKYLMFSKTTLSVSDWRVVGVLGETAHDRLNVPSPSDSSAVAIALDGGFLLSRGSHQSEYFGPGLDEQLTADTHAALSAGAWYSASLLRGEARVHKISSGRYLPQDMNYDTRGWVNFKKGCYTGQEIIARLHWRGKPKRRLYLAQFEGDVVSAVGASLTLKDSDKTVGSVINSAHQDLHVTVAVEATVEAAQATCRVGQDGPAIGLSAAPEPPTG